MSKQIINDWRPEVGAIIKRLTDARMKHKTTSLNQMVRQMEMVKKKQSLPTESTAGNQQKLRPLRKPGRSLLYTIDVAAELAELSESARRKLVGS